MKRERKIDSAGVEAEKKKRVLLSFAGSHDPYSGNQKSGGGTQGPVLSIARELRFDSIILLSTQGMEMPAEKTAAALEEHRQGISVHIEKTGLTDPTDHIRILKAVRKVLKKRCHLLENASIAVSVTSGTSQIHACWFLLAASGELPCQVLQIRPDRYITARAPRISSIDFTNPEFPRVLPRVRNLDWEESVSVNVAVLLEQTGLAGQSPVFLRAAEEAVRFGNSGLTMLLLGESGSGKELFARLVHEASGRQGRFVAFNASALPETLMESELFGHKKGAFTGAERDHKGLFEQAENGTLFIDEIGDMPPALQVKLLRVLEDRKIRPIGAEKDRKVDVRFVAATNADLRKKIRDGLFRQDLFQRISGMTIRIPPLRERRDDVAFIARHFLSRSNAVKPPAISKEALLMLENHSWPGNVRELHNVIERAMVLAANSSIIEREHIRIDFHPDEDSAQDMLPEPHEGFNLKIYEQQSSRKLKLRALELAQNNASAAARLLGIRPQAMNRFVKEERERNGL
jgi:DNA-binding NtrC family response regulator